MKGSLSFYSRLCLFAWLLAASAGACLGAQLVEFNHVGRWLKIGWNFDRVFAHGHYIVASARTNGWHIIDAQNPAAPRRIYTNTFNVLEFEYKAGELLTGNGIETHRWNLANPVLPERTGRIRKDGLSPAFYSGGYLMSFHSFGFYHIRSSFQDPGPFPGLSRDHHWPVAGEYPIIYAGRYGSGPVIYRHTDSTTQPLEILARLRHTNITELHVQSDKMFVGGSFEMAIYDVSNPSLPIRLSHTPLSGVVTSLTTQDSLLYLTHSGKAHVYDISNPSRLTLAGTLDTPGNVSQVAFNQNLVYVADGTNGINIYRQTIKEAPVIKEEVRIIPTTASDMVHDELRNCLYISSTTNLLIYDFTTESFKPPIVLGGELLGVDLSPDGNHLAVADGLGSATGNWFHLVDLRDQSVKRVDVNSGIYEGTYAVAFGADGKILISSEYWGSGWVPLSRYDLSTGQITEHGSIRQNSMVSASGDRKLIGVAEGNSSGGEVRLFETKSGYLEYGTRHYYFNYEITVNSDGSQFASPTYGGLFVFDRQYKQLVKMGTPSRTSPIGAAYHPLAPLLFTAWAETNQVRLHDTATFKELKRFDLPNQQLRHPGNRSFRSGRIRVSRDGATAFVLVPDGIAVINHGLVYHPVVTSSFGSSTTNYYLADTLATNSIPPSVEIAGTRFTAMGAQVSGVPEVSSGPTNVTFYATESGTIQWNWKASEHEVKARVTGSGTVSSPGGWLPHAGTFTVIAQPRPGYKFVQWMGDVPHSLMLSNRLELPVNAPLNLRSIFAPINSSGGLSGDWTTYGNNPQHTGYFPGKLGEEKFVPLWSANLSNAVNQPVIAEGKVYATAIGYSPGAFLVALNAHEGSFEWGNTYLPAPSGMFAPTYDDGSLFFARVNNTGDTQLYKIQAATGRSLWVFPFGVQSGRFEAPVVADGKAWFPGGNYGGMYGVDTTHGKMIFHSEFADDDDWTPAYWNGQLFSFTEGTFREHHPERNIIHWSTNLTGNVASVRPFPIANGIACITSESHGLVSHLIAIDLQSRAIRWKVQGRIHGSASIAGDSVYIKKDGSVETYALANGQPGVFFPGADDFPHPPIVTDDVLIVPNRQSTLVFDLATQRLIQTIPIGGRLSLANNTLYIPDISGHLHAWQARSQPPALEFESRTGTTFTLTFRGQAGMRYTLEMSPNLLPKSWTSHTTFLISPTNRVMRAIVPLEIGQHEFFRIVEQSP